MHPEQLLYEVAIPAAAALILAMIVRREWIAPVALTLAFLLGSRFVIGRFPGFPPASAQNWLFYKAILIGVAVLAAVNANSCTKAGLIFVLTADVLSRVLGHMIGRWSGAEVLLWVGIPSLIATLWWAAMAMLIERSKDWASHIILAILITATGMLLIMSVAASLGRMGLALAGGVAALALSSVYLKHPRMISAAIPAISVIQIALLCGGRFTGGAETLTLHAGILLGAPAFAWIGQIPFIQRLSPGKRFLLRILLPILPMGLSLGLAMPAFLENMRGELY